MLSFSLDYTYTDQDAIASAGGNANLSTLTQTFEIKVRTDVHEYGFEAIISEGMTILEELIEESEIKIPVIDSTNSTTTQWLIDDDFMAALLEDQSDVTNSTQLEELQDEVEDSLEEGDFSEDGILVEEMPQEEDKLEDS